MFSSLTDTDGDPPNNWIYLIVAIVVVTIIAYISWIPVNAGHIGATNITITEKYVSSCGVCSCIHCSDRFHHTATFQNYCPMCGHYGTLAYEEGPASYTCPEGMWRCGFCDADYCLVHGTEHSYNPKGYLKPYTPTVIELQGNKLL